MSAHDPQIDSTMDQKTLPSVVGIAVLGLGELIALTWFSVRNRTFPIKSRFPLLVILQNIGLTGISVFGTVYTIYKRLGMTCIGFSLLESVLVLLYLDSIMVRVILLESRAQFQTHLSVPTIQKEGGLFRSTFSALHKRVKSGSLFRGVSVDSNLSGIPEGTPRGSTRVGSEMVDEKVQLSTLNVEDNAGQHHPRDRNKQAQADITLVDKLVGVFKAGPLHRHIKSRWQTYMPSFLAMLVLQQLPILLYFIIEAEFAFVDPKDPRCQGAASVRHWIIVFFFLFDSVVIFYFRPRLNQIDERLAIRFELSITVIVLLFQAVWSFISFISGNNELDTQYYFLTSTVPGIILLYFSLIRILGHTFTQNKSEVHQQKIPDNVAEALARSMKQMAMNNESTTAIVEELRQCLRSAEGLELYSAFMKAEFCMENVLFWKAIDEFEKHAPHMDPPAMREYCYDMYVTFILPEAALSINIPYGVRRAIQLVLYPNASVSRSRTVKFLSMLKSTENLSVRKITFTTDPPQTPAALPMAGSSPSSEDEIGPRRPTSARSISSTTPGPAAIRSRFSVEDKTNEVEPKSLYRNDSGLRSGLYNQVDDSKFGPELFAEAKHEAFDLMCKDSFVRFRRTNQYKIYFTRKQLEETGGTVIASEQLQEVLEHDRSPRS
eukprot:TRINITY_DN12419_c0_g1_i1.p1 TRINITY_DN12419_c0_g1~~TRINITY_DN12419_c0_g1_i1.p1  ORF type:complete len:662 (-),score=117.29 TRINITY_DN12419_c0_g1_i1:970-2955(-)